MRMPLKYCFLASLFLGCAQPIDELVPYAEYEPVLPVRVFEEVQPEELPEPTVRRPEERELNNEPNEMLETDNELRDLPMPWMPGAFDVVSTSLERIVTADEHVVGFIPSQTGSIIAGTRGGGLFVSEPGRAWMPIPSVLPALSSFHGDARVWLACPMDGSRALASFDGGLGWAQLAVGCASTGIDGAHLTDDDFYVFLPNGDLRIGPLGPGEARTSFVPLSEPRIVAAQGSHVVALGDNAVAWSDDRGHSFYPGSWSLEQSLIEIRDAAFADKGVVVAVGRAERGQHGIVLSRDYGQTWNVPTALPRGTHDMRGVAVNWAGDIFISPTHPTGQAVLSQDGGRTWAASLNDWPIAGPAAATNDGFVVGASRGMAIGLTHETSIAPAVLESALRHVVFTHPLVAVAAGARGGLYRTVDGGKNWRTITHSMGTRFRDLTSPGAHSVFALGDGFIWKSDDAGAHWESSALAHECDGRWLRFYGEIGLVGCADGGPLLSTDGGMTWRADTSGQNGFAPMLFLPSEQRLVSLTPNGLSFIILDTNRFEWSEQALPRGIEGVELRAENGGLSLLTSEGEIARISALDRPWSWRTGLAAAHGHEWRLHVPLPSGQVLLADAKGLYRIGDDGLLRSLGTTDSPHTIVLKGDGGLMVLGESVTTSFHAH